MSKKPNYTLFPWLLVLYEIAIYLSMDAYMPGLPDIASVFSISANVAQYTATIWMLGGLLVQFIFGPLSDRYGRRPILLFSGLLYIIATLICAVAPNITILLIARLLQGMAMPAMFIAGYAAINELFDSETAVSILARMNGVTILAPAFGPLLGSAFLLAFNWRWIFVILAIWAFIAVVMLFFKMPETTTVTSRAKPLNIVEILGQYTALFTNFRFMAFSLLAFLPIIGLIAWILAGPFLVVEKFHYSIVVYGVIQIFVFGSFIIGTKIVNEYATKKRNHFLINIGISSVLIGAILATITSWYLPDRLFIFVIAIMFVTLGGGLSLPILSRLALETSDISMGVRVTIFSTVRIGSGVIGSACLAIFFNGTMLSVAEIILFFAVTGVILRGFCRQ